MSWRRCRAPLDTDITDPVRCVALPGVVSGRHAGVGRLSGVLLIIRSVRQFHTPRVPTLRVGVINRRLWAPTRDWITPHPPLIPDFSRRERVLLDKQVYVVVCGPAGND